MKYFFPIFFVFSSILLNAQLDKKINATIICKYDVKFLKDTLDEFTRKEEMMTLFIGDNISLYKNDQKNKIDSLKSGIVHKNVTQAIKDKNSVINLDFSKIPKIHLYNEVLSDNGKLFVFDKIFNMFFVYPINPNIKWQITSETQVINKYNCKKALGNFGKRIYTAWFTEEVPIPEGPYVFKGLPGLIVSLKDSKNYYSFELTYLERKSINVSTMANAVLTDEQKFYKARQDSKDNAVGNVKMVIHREMTKEEEEQIKRNANKNNNNLN